MNGLSHVITSTDIDGQWSIVLKKENYVVVFTQIRWVIIKCWTLCILAVYEYNRVYII